VSQNTNFGSFFSAGTSTLTMPPTLATTTLALGTSIPASGTYLSLLSVQATLKSASGLPLAGEPITFSVGELAVTAMTGANGVATTTIQLGALPGTYTLGASFGGDASNRSSAATKSFTILKKPTSVKFISTTGASTSQSISGVFMATDGTPLIERGVVFILAKGSAKYVDFEITDGTGEARIRSTSIPAGTYQATGYFGSSVTLPGGTVANLTDPLYGPSSASTPITISVSP
jgi:hypothetical protein